MRIANKLALGFGSVLLLTGLVVGLDYLSSAYATRTINATNRARLPAMLQASRAHASLLRMISGVHGYLALGEHRYRAEYALAYQSFQREIQQLAQSPAITRDASDGERLRQLQQALTLWMPLPDLLFAIRDDQLRREPALRILQEDLQPVLLRMVQDVRAMVNTQSQRDPSRDNLLLLGTMGNLQSSVFAMIAGARTYITTLRPGFKTEYTSNLTLNTNAWEMLQKQQLLLTTSQQGALERIAQLRPALIQLANQAVAVAESEHVREDLYLFRTQAMPVAETMLQILSDLTTTQQERLSADLQSGVEHLTTSRRNALLIGIFAVMFGTGGAIILYRSMIDPLHRLTAVAEQIRQGNLDIRAEEDSHHEFGTFAATFNEMTTQLTHAKTEAETANRAKSTFLANMSHELRTPLNAILGFAQILARTPNLPADSQEYLAIILRSGDHLLTLINQVLDLSKIEAGRITLNEKEIDLHRLLGDLEDLFRLRAADKGLSVQFERAPDVPRFIRTDEVKLRQVLINLLNNAIKFTKHGGVTLKIVDLGFETLDFSTPQSDSLNHKSQIINLKFEISDTGPGIAPDELGAIFDPFVQSATGRQAQEGTGLGLSISRRFVQLMGGDITVRSVLGQGATFTFVIRCQLGTSTVLPADIPDKRLIGVAPGQPRYRLLIVDDTFENRRLLLTLLTPFGFELREAANGQKAVEIWQQWQPHLIWMDLRMPVMGGYEATQKIREQEAEGRRQDNPHSSLFALHSSLHTVIIALSASSLEDESATALAKGCDDFLRKPFREHEIFDLLHKHLGVQFVYADDSPAPVGSEPPRDKAELLAEHLAALPADLRRELQEAIESLDMEKTLHVTNLIRQHNALLAESVAELVKQYRFDLLQTLFNPSEASLF